MVNVNTQPLRQAGRTTGNTSGSRTQPGVRTASNDSIFTQSGRTTMPGPGNGFRMYDGPKAGGYQQTKHFGEINGKQYADGHIGGEKPHHSHHSEHHGDHRAENRQPSFFERLFGRRPEPKANPFEHQSRR